jgi:hypothetical protein
MGLSIGIGQMDEMAAAIRVLQSRWDFIKSNAVVRNIISLELNCLKVRRVIEDVEPNANRPNGSYRQILKSPAL